VIKSLAARYPWIHAINLMRNSGQHNALLCGIRAARYEVTITLDDDLQQPPEEIHKLVDKYREGYDVVYGSPAKMPHELWRNFSSRFTKKVMALVMGIPNVINIGPFRIFRTELRKAFNNYQSPNVIIDVLLSWATNRFGVVQVEEHPRKFGKSNYTFLKLVSAAFLVLTGYSTIPLRFASLVGFAITLFGVGVFLYVIIKYMLQGSLPGFPFLASIITIFSGAQLFTLGIIGEYIASIFNRSTDRPPYVIDIEIFGKH
jgi:undecaprenyl-phosphate 4-deoxy-4-formamido-L-arabinose transferase